MFFLLYSMISLAHASANKSPLLADSCATKPLIRSVASLASAITLPEYSCGTLKAADGKTDLYYRMVKPVNFDPNKKYPTIIYVYGGPHAHNVDARWHYSSRGWETYMAQNGYLLFTTSIIENEK